MKTSRYYHAAFYAAMFWLLSACSSSNTGAKAVTRTAAYPNIIEKASKSHRYMVMQSGINLYTVKSVDVDKPKQEMTVTLDRVDSSRLVNVKSFENNPSKSWNAEVPVVAQLHFYMSDSTSYTLDEPHTIPMSKVGRIVLIK